MNNEELKAVLHSGEPVLFQEKQYSCVNGIIYRRKDRGKLFIQVELLDRNQNCVVIASPERVFFLDDPVGIGCPKEGV